MSNIVPTYERFDSNGLELVVNTQTGLAYASVSATARMLQISKSTVSDSVRELDTLEAEIQTAAGLRSVRLISSATVFKLALKYNLELAE